MRLTAGVEFKPRVQRYGGEFLLRIVNQQAGEFEGAGRGGSVGAGPVCGAGDVEGNGFERARFEQRREERPQRVITPVDSIHRTVLTAIDRGMLANLLFDNQVLASHRLMAAVLNAILRLPPLKQALASRQMRSRYLVTLLARRPQGS